MKYLIAHILVALGFLAYGQEQNDTVLLSTIYLDEVVVFDKKVKVKRLGFVKKENLTFSLYKDYEIGAYIENPEGLHSITDLHFKVDNNLEEELNIEINFYDFNKKPGKLIRSINANIARSKKNKLIISSGRNIEMEFPKNGVFISTKIKSYLDKEKHKRFRVYLSQKYNTRATFIRGSIYREEWTELSELNLRKGKIINVCYGILAQ